MNAGEYPRLSREFGWPADDVTRRHRIPGRPAGPAARPVGPPPGPRPGGPALRPPPASTVCHAPAAPAMTSIIRPSQRGWTGRLTIGRTWPLTVLIGLIALAVRAIGLGRANDLFVDELIYAQIGDSVAHGRIPTFQGTHFYLHPIGSFLLDAVFLKLFGLGSLPPMDLVYALRWLTALLGAVTVVLGFRLLRKVVPLPIALGGAAVLAFDPFILRNDSRVMLETPATMWTLGAWLLLLGVLTNPATPRVRRWREVGVGVIFGLALTTKDMTAIQILVPLAAAVIWRRTLAPAQAGRIVLGSLLPYTVLIAVVAATGDLGEWGSQKLGGLRRLIGLDQMTGFHASNVSLVGRLVAELSRFGTSYVLLGLCLFAGLGTVFAKSTARRLMGLIGVATGLFGVYSVVAGALEEQFGYYTVVVAVVVSATSIAELRDRRRTLRRPLAIAASVFVAATLCLGVSARLTVDDTFPQARAWMATNLPADARVGLTGPVAQLAFPPRDGWGDWPSLTQLRDNNAQYVLTSSQPLAQGYGDAAPQMLTWMTQHARPLYTAHGPSNGDTTVWQVDRPALDAAVAAGQDVPPVSESG
ncbi:MAG TPA: phospholipid carrier-dependent glycosyltransferase [Actinomycetospora sp.]|uniref:ArnT family glycosyltransferase n=1 Tax=Actinomycetospora sp. TaxID=1872135 RepID=UPI002F3FDAFF